MKFHILNLYIWLNNGKRRTISFEPNKVNIITGGSLTGKTAILDIIDYCFFASKHTISEAAINERSSWYGLKFFIEGKTYTIARRAPVEGAVSADYFFSSIGDSPDEEPTVTNTDAALKKMLGTDFGIDQDAKVSFGGNTIKAGSRVSLRYFFLFNTVSQDIITHSKEFFDKQSDNRYREALPRTFDLAVGIDTIANILRREKRTELEKKLKRLEKERDTTSRKSGLFHEQLADIERRSKEFGLIGDDEDSENAMVALSEMISRQEVQTRDVVPSRFDQIASDIGLASLKIRSLMKFSTEYSKYKQALKTTSDSLKPVDFLVKNYTELVRTSIFGTLVEALEHDHREIKSAIANKTPLDSNVSDLLKNLERQRKMLQEELDNLPREIKTFDLEREKYIFLGETKAKLDLYADQSGSELIDTSDKISKLEGQIASLEVQSIEERRDLFITVMNEMTQNYVDETATALGDYGNYRTYFDYKDKRLQLRKPKSLFIENVGSSSNHMFLHLFMFLGLHEIIISNKVPHVPPFLIIDQFSRPYWGEKGEEKEELESSDVTKVKCALKLLNNFINRVVVSGEEFQMIVFEHIPEEYWRGMENIHLVEKFEDGNALIPDELI